MEQLQYQLKSLRLSAMAGVLPVRLQEARANDLPHAEFLSHLIQDELDKRKERLLNRRLKAASFPELKTIDAFNFNFNPSVNKKLILELYASAFVHRAESVILLGPPGVGKTHLAISLGIGATVIATNRPIEDWGKILGDNAAASAILDRLMEHMHLVSISGRSYRLKSIVNNDSDVKKELDNNTQN
jgi:DNA replication protein DnaC